MYSYGVQLTSMTALCCLLPVGFDVYFQLQLYNLFPLCMNVLQHA